MITLDTEDNSVDFECFGCMLSKNMAILQSLAEQGLLDPSAQPAQS